MSKATPVIAKTLRIKVEIHNEIEAWRTENTVSYNEAVNRLLEEGLKHSKDRA